MSVGKLGGVPHEGFDLPDSAVGEETPAQAEAPILRGGSGGRPGAVQAAGAAEAADSGKLLTKKMAGERALAHHLTSRGFPALPGRHPREVRAAPKYEAKVIPGNDRDHYLVKLHKRAATPPFATEPNPEAVYAVDRHDGKIALEGAEAGPGGAGAAAKMAGAAALAGAPGVKNLGELARPGKVLRDAAQALRPGDALRFATRENQIFGLGEIKVEPRGALEVKRRLLDSAPPGRLGGTSLYEYVIAVPPGAKAGAAIQVRTSGHFQTRQDPDWAFSFGVKVSGGPPAPAGA